MRIAYMLTSLGIGGAERQVVALAERMAGRGHEVVLIVLRPRQQHEWPIRVEVLRLDMTKSPPGVIRALFRGWRFLRQFKPDILHSHTFPANIVARVLRLLGATPKVISTIHNVYEGDWRRTLAYRLTDPLSRHTTAVSKAVADRHIEIGAVRWSKCSVITNGIDVEVFAPTLASASACDKSARAFYEFVWLAAGRDVPAKDFGNLLAAFELVRSQAPRAQLWIAGEPDTKRMNQQQVCGVRWLGLRKDMAATIAAGDAFVLSSAWEDMPLVVGEAMAMEKLVVATDVGGVRELVGDAGLIVASKSPAALAQAMLNVMRMSPTSRREIGRVARTRICRHFDMNSKANEWKKLYLEIMGLRPVARPRFAHGRLMSEFPHGANKE